MRKKSFWILFFCSMLLMMVLAPLRGYVSIQASTLASFTCFFYFTVYCVRKYNAQLTGSVILIALIVGEMILTLPIRIIDFRGSLISLPDELFHILGIVFGFAFTQIRSGAKYFVAAAGFVAAIFMFTNGTDLWFNKLDFGTFTGRVFETMPEKFEAVNEQNQTITNENFKNK